MFDMMARINENLRRDMFNRDCRHLSFTGGGQVSIEDSRVTP